MRGFSIKTNSYGERSPLERVVIFYANAKAFARSAQSACPFSPSVSAEIFTKISIRSFDETIGPRCVCRARFMTNIVHLAKMCYI